MPDAFISMTTSWASGAGSGNCISSSPRSPVNTTPRIAASVCFCLRSDLERKNAIGKGRTDRELALLRVSSLHSRRGKTFPGSNRARGDVDHQGEQRGIENKRDDAVRGGGAADGLVG